MADKEPVLPASSPPAIAGVEGATAPAPPPPHAETSSAAPAAASPPAAAPVLAEAPKVDAAPQPAARAAAAAPKPAEAPALEPSLLELADKAKPKDEPKKDAGAEKPSDAKPDEKPPEPKPADKPKEGPKPAEKPAETKAANIPVEPAKPAPVEYKYELPATLKMDNALKSRVEGIFDEFRADPGANVQKLIDLHNEQMTSYADHLGKEQVRIFNETRANWRKEVLADPEIGGAGHETAMGAIARMRDLTVPEGDRDSFNQFLAVTGAGDHPVFLRMLHNFARYFDEPTVAPPNAKPPADIGSTPPRRMRDLYGKNGQGARP